MVAMGHRSDNIPYARVTKSCDRISLSNVWLINLFHCSCWCILVLACSSGKTKHRLLCLRLPMAVATCFEVGAVLALALLDRVVREGSACNHTNHHCHNRTGEHRERREIHCHCRSSERYRFAIITGNLSSPIDGWCGPSKY